MATRVIHHEVYRDMVIDVHGKKYAIDHRGNCEMSVSDAEHVCSLGGGGKFWSATGIKPATAPDPQSPADAVVSDPPAATLKQRRKPGNKRR